VEGSTSHIKDIRLVHTGLLSEVVDIKRFDNHHALAKYAELVKSQYQSGDGKSETTNRVRTYNNYSRYYLIQIVFFSKKYNEVRRFNTNTLSS